LITGVKIKMYVAVVALVVMPAPAAAAPPAGVPGGWEQVGYGAGRTYYNPDESRLNAATVGGLQQRWTAATHSSSLCAVGAAPVVSGGRLFTSDPGGIGAYDPATGARRWHVEMERTTVRHLAVADGKRTLWRTTQNWYAVGSDPAGKRFYIDGPGLSAIDAATGRNGPTACRPTSTTRP
jgi:outer membrane protein assembly factor BamB